MEATVSKSAVFTRCCRGNSVLNYKQMLVLVLLSLIPAGLLQTALEAENKAVELTAAVSDHVVFNCQLDYLQEIVIPHEVHWRKENQIVFTYKRGSLTAMEPYVGRVRSLGPPYGEGSVNMTNIRESDGGWYECRLYFPTRSPPSKANGTWFHLTVEGDYLIAVPPNNQTVMEGSAAHFPCVTKDRTSTVTWFKDGEALSELHELLVRSVVSPEGSLTISPTKMDDPGEYACVVVGADDRVQRTSAHLNVQYKAKVMYAAHEVFMPIGRPGLLDCHFRANPPLTNLRWDKDGFLFDPYNVKGVYFKRNGSLFFKEVNETHAGNYTCTPFNDLGTEGPSSVMSVIVQKPPKFSLTPHNLYLRRKGASVLMPCDAWDGDSNKYKPSIKWIRKDGHPLPAGRASLSGSNLTLEGIEEDDRGVYACVAANEAATISVETELMVENIAPRSPYNLSATSGLDTLTVSWASGLPSPEGSAESVWYRAAEVPLWRALPAADSHQMTIYDLLPGTLYEVMVLSQDIHGDGMFSKSIQVQTQGVAADIPSQEFQRNGSTEDWRVSAPRHLRVEPMGSGYQITWDEPEDGAENVSHFTVRWTYAPDKGGSSDTTQYTHLVEALEEDKTYTFQVFAVSSDGHVAESSSLIVHVPSYRPVRALSITLALTLLLIVLAAGGWLLRKRLTK